MNSNAGHCGDVGVGEQKGDLCRLSLGCYVLLYPVKNGVNSRKIGDLEMGYCTTRGVLKV